jgi:cysteine desulfurase/selenocysteine lyase
MEFLENESERQRLFPICRENAFFGHAGVSPLPAAVAEAMANAAWASADRPPDFSIVLRELRAARQLCARLIGSEPDEIALLGPTSLGLSLVANGLSWEAGDEVICYAGDYPANVYPWFELRRRGVTVRLLEPETPGEITPELVEAAMTPRTRLVALASAHFFSGYRIDLDEIGRRVHAGGALFCVDAIQTLGAFPTEVREVDFLSADAHKWMLGPVAIGIVYVRREHWDLLRPTLIGAWNTVCPDFITRDEVEFVRSAQRYEPGVLNFPGIAGMCAGIEMLLSLGIDRIAERLLWLKGYLVRELRELGFEIVGRAEGVYASGITSCRHPAVDARELCRRLEEERVFTSLRHDKQGNTYVRWSPHFYNTEAEIDRALAILRREIG